MLDKVAQISDGADRWPSTNLESTFLSAKNKDLYVTLLSVELPQKTGKLASPALLGCETFQIINLYHELDVDQTDWP